MRSCQRRSMVERAAAVMEDQEESGGGVGDGGVGLVGAEVRDGDELLPRRGIVDRESVARSRAEPTAVDVTSVANQRGIAQAETLTERRALVVQGVRGDERSRVAERADGREGRIHPERVGIAN